MIARVGEYEFNPAAPLKQITLADLPKSEMNRERQVRLRKRLDRSQACGTKRLTWSYERKHYAHC